MYIRVMRKESKDNFWSYGWVFSSENLKAAKSLIDKWNLRELGKRKWSVEVVNKKDFDFPV